MPAVCSRRPKLGNRISPDPRSGNHEIHEPHEKGRMIIANRRDGFGAGPGLLAASPFGVFRVFRGFSTSVCGAGMSVQILLCSLRADGAGVRQRETWNSSAPARGLSMHYPPSSSSGLRRGRLGQRPGKATCKRRASEGIETIKPYTSQVQARCKPDASRLQAGCSGGAFVFSSYSLRILLVFSWYSLREPTRCGRVLSGWPVDFCGLRCEKGLQSPQTITCDGVFRP